MTAAEVRSAVVTVGGGFMTSQQMRAQEDAMGLPPRSLYFRGRSAVLGEPPPGVVAATFGIFPDRLVEAVITGTTALPAAAAVSAYGRACAAWGVDHLSGVVAAGEAAELLYDVADATDPGALPLFAGWRTQQRPREAPARLAHALMVVRELRGGLHFAALRACGLSVIEATVVEPAGGRERLLRTGWSSDAADALVRSAANRADLPERWRRAEQMTEDSFGRCVRSLGPQRAARLHELLPSLVPSG